MKKIIILLFLINGISVYSQRTITYPTTSNLKDGIFNNPNWLLKRNAAFDHTFSEFKSEKYKDISKIKGSPYKNKVFTIGILKLKEDTLDSVYYRINTYQNEIEIKNIYNDSVYFKINKVLGIKLIGKKEQYEVKAIKTKGMEVEHKIVENLYPKEGELLFELTDTKFKEGKTATSSMVKSTIDQFISKKYYFFNLDGKGLIKLENKKMFLKDIKKNQDIVKKFIKNEKINFNNKKHLIKLLKFYSKNK